MAGVIVEFAVVRASVGAAEPGIQGAHFKLDGLDGFPLSVTPVIQPLSR